MITSSPKRNLLKNSYFRIFFIILLLQKFYTQLTYLILLMFFTLSSHFDKEHKTGKILFARSITKMPIGLDLKPS